MDDTEIELARARYGIRAARGSGIYEGMSRCARSLDTAFGQTLEGIREDEFVSRYPEAKRILKGIAENAEAYDDVNRVAMTLAVCAEAKEWAPFVYRRLVGDLSEGQIQNFWESFCPEVEPYAYEGIDDGFFDVVSVILDEHPDRVSIHLVTDNWPPLYRGAIEPALRRRMQDARSRGKRVPDFEYRSFVEYDTGASSFAYISGEGWGNKMDPETWRRILFEDLGIDDFDGDDDSEADKVILVDDSMKKLRGLEEFSRERRKVLSPYTYDGESEIGLKPVLVQFGGEEDIEDNGIIRISNISEIANIVSQHARRQVSQ